MILVQCHKGAGLSSQSLGHPLAGGQVLSRAEAPWPLLTVCPSLPLRVLLETSVPLAPLEQE